MCPFQVRRRWAHVAFPILHCRAAIILHKAWSSRVSTFIALEWRAANQDSKSNLRVIKQKVCLE